MPFGGRGIFPFEIYFLFLIFFVFVGLHPWHMEVPRLGVELELQPLAYARATAKQDLSLVCHLHHRSWQHQILNPMSEARDPTCVLMDASQIHFRWAMTGTPQNIFNASLNNRCSRMGWFFFLSCGLEVPFLAGWFCKICVPSPCTISAVYSSLKKKTPQDIVIFHNNDLHVKCHNLQSQECLDRIGILGWQSHRNVGGSYQHLSL